MADFGLTRAIGRAVRKGSSQATVVRPGQAEAFAEEAAKKRAKLAPQVVAAEPVTPAATVVQPVLDEVPAPIVTQPKLTPAEQTAADSEATRLSRVNLGDYALDQAHMPNFDRITSADDVKAVIADMAEKNKGRVNEARRNVITDEQMRGLAHDLNTTTDVVQTAIKRESGGQFSPEVLMATRQWVNSSAERLKELALKMTKGAATDADRVAFARQQQLHSAVYDQFMGARAEWGRAGRVLNAPLGSSPEQLTRMRELIDNVGNGKDLEKLARAIADTDTVAGIGKAATQFGRSRILGTLQELFVSSILSGPRTFIVNATGSAIQLMNVAETAVAARIGRFLPGGEHVQVGEASAMLHGTFTAVADAWKVAALAFRTGRSVDDVVKFETGRPKAISAVNYLAPDKRNTPLGRFVDVIGAVIRAPMERVMVPTDEFFKTLAYRAEVERGAFQHVSEGLQKGTIAIENADQAAREFMENTPLRAQDASEQYAREVTFQSELGTAGKTVERLVKQVPGLSLIAPFIRTPTNIFKQAHGRRSPLAVFSAKFYQDIAKGGRARDLALARVSMGTLTAGLVANYVVDGTITGGGPQDDAARQVLQATGWRPYSIRVRNPLTNEVSYHSYARIEPMAFIIGATADTVEILSYINSDVETLKDEEVQAYDAAAAIIAGIANNTMSKTFMKGMADTTEMLSDPKRYVKQWTSNFATAFIPYSSFRRQFNQAADPYMREAWTLLDKIKVGSGIPGYSKDMPPRRDIFGDPRSVASGELLGPMSPMPSSPVRYESVTRELKAVMEASRVVPVTMPDKRIEGLRLLAPEYDKLVKLSRQEPIFDGLTFKEALDETMSSTVYMEATPVGKAELLRDVQRRADEIAKAMLEVEDESFAERIALFRDKKNRLRFGEQ